MGHTVPWQDGRRAWARLGWWYQRAVSEGGPAQPEASLGALSDVRLVRGLLHQAEYTAVRFALESGRPLSEISAILGISRDEAQARWGDLVPPGS